MRFLDGQLFDVLLFEAFHEVVFPAAHELLVGLNRVGDAETEALLDFLALQGVVLRGQNLLVALHLQGKGCQDVGVLQCKQGPSEYLTVYVVFLDLVEQKVESVLAKRLEVWN